ncbi:MAG: hypothetical protein DMF45_05510 [Verrucomicrobia bacterium]|nr:MAG: hypothetical protein DMF45_05510 [Verrucomicrobiota bacterium]
MTTKHDLAEAVVIERTFNAPVGRVWKALTDVEEMRQWYFNLKQFKAEVGFEFEFVVEQTAIIGSELKQFLEGKQKGKS